MKLTTRKRTLVSAFAFAAALSQQALYADDLYANDLDPESGPVAATASGKAEEVKVMTPGPAAGGQEARFVSDFSMFSGACFIGPSSRDVIFTCFGFGFSAAFPNTVFCQTRQTDNADFGFPDQFGCQIISTSPGTVVFRIRRLDDGTDSSGWGQNLRADVLIIE
jgi:hypothetical protein